MANRTGLLSVDSILLSDTKPALINIDPFFGTSSFQVDQSIQLLFNKAVIAGSGDIILSNGSDIRTIPINDTDQVSFDEDIVTINPTTDLVVDTTYNIHIASGVIVDAEDRIFDGITNHNFTTIPATDPLLSSSLDGEIEFQVDQNIQLYFDESVMAGTGNIIISNGTDTRTIAIDDASQVTFTGFSGKVRIDPVEDLLGDTEYSIQIAPGVITDIAGNAYAGSSDITFATITTDPELSGSNPINHSTIKADENIELFFNRTVKAGLGDFIMSNGTDVRTIAITDASQVTFSSNGVIINPTDDLIVDTTYTVQMARGVIADTAGHDYAGFKDAIFTTIASNPILHSSSINNFSRTVIDDDIKLFFDEPVIAGNGNIIISNGTDVRTIAADDSSQITFNSYELTINPSEDLIPDTTYTIQIENSAITDLAGHAYAGISDLEVTPISSDPFIISSNIGSTHKVDNDIKLFLNEVVELGNGNVVISNGSDTRTIAIDDASQITFSQPFNSSGERSVLTISPAADLIANTTYMVQIDQGIVSDTAGHKFAGFGSTAFSTIVSDPLLTSSQPQDGSIIKIDDDIQLFFDEEVQAGNGNIVISNGTDTRVIAVGDSNQVSFSFISFGLAFAATDVADSGALVNGGYALTINPTENLEADTTYTVQIDRGVIVDKAGHAYSGLNGAVFSTITSEPRLVNSNPIEGSIIKTNGDINLEFDETMMAGSGNIILSSDSDTRTIAINDTEQVSFSGGKVTINPIEDLISDTTYSVQMASGVIADEAGNNYAGFSDAMITTTNSNPLLTSSNPTEGSLIKTDGTIQLQFDENVVAGNGDIVLSNGADTRTIAINDASQVNFNGSKVVGINPTEDLIADTTYSVQIPSGTITDEVGNPYDGFSNAMVTVTDAPILTNFFNKNNQVSTHHNFILRFDEEVAVGSGDIVISNGTDIRTIAVDDSSQVIFGDFGDVNSVTINPSEDLVADTVYQIQMTSGVIVDTDDNPYSGIRAGMFEFTAREFEFSVDPFSPIL